MEYFFRGYVFAEYLFGGDANSKKGTSSLVHGIKLRSGLCVASIDVNLTGNAIQ